MKAAISWVIVLLLVCSCEQGKKEPVRDQPVEKAPQDKVAPAPSEVSPHPIASYEIDVLRKRGLNDPIAQIVEDLRSHPEIIPHHGDLGGTMGFYDPDGIRVLSSRWVYARFEDGHVGGSGIFEFKVDPGGTLTWSVVSSAMEP